LCAYCSLLGGGSSRQNVHSVHSFHSVQAICTKTAPRKALGYFAQQ